MIAGNFEDKYHSKNPISQILVSNFLSDLKSFLSQSADAKKIVELGTGEGELMKILSNHFPNLIIWGSDISKKMVKTARENLKGKRVKLSAQDIEKLSYPDESFDLVICCEVLEHVKHPEIALDEIKRISKDKIILSVPVEPLWLILNMSRGHYLRQFGNTPGHINHFTPISLIRLVKQKGFKILSKKYPLPWQMLLLEKP